MVFDYIYLFSPCYHFQWQEHARHHSSLVTIDAAYPPHGNAMVIMTVWTSLMNSIVFVSLRTASNIQVSFRSLFIVTMTWFCLLFTVTCFACDVGQSVFGFEFHPRSLLCTFSTQLVLKLIFFPCCTLLMRPNYSGQEKVDATLLENDTFWCSSFCSILFASSANCLTPQAPQFNILQALWCVQSKK